MTAARRIAVAVAVALVAATSAGCDRGADAPVGHRPPRGAPAPTTTSTTGSTTTTASTTTAPPAAGSAATTAQPPAAAAGCPTVPERARPPAGRPHYRISIDVRPDDLLVLGEQVVRFTPDLDVDELVLRLWANAPRIAARGGGIEVTRSSIPPASQPDPTTLVLPRRTRAGETLELSLAWRLRLPSRPTNDRVAVAGGAVRLGSFFPVLAWDPGRGWAREPPTSAFAESSIGVPSDFDVHVRVPAGLEAVATGTPDGTGRWTATAVSDWAVSIGRWSFARRSVDGGAGPVEVVVAVHAGVEEAPEPFADKVARAIVDFGRRFGAYPWPAYTLAVTPELSGGIEYPMHVMQGPGTIGRTTSHEVAHQWFYGLVPTNQGSEPWIDEGLATYAEGRFEGTLADLRARSIPAGGRGRAGEPMTYWESRQSIYYRSVYVQGAQAVAALGPAELVDCALRHLVARRAYRVTHDGDVLDVLATVFPDAEAVLSRYGIRR